MRGRQSVPGDKVQFHKLAESLERRTFLAPAVILLGLDTLWLVVAAMVYVYLWMCQGKRETKVWAGLVLQVASETRTTRALLTFLGACTAKVMDIDGQPLVAPSDSEGREYRGFLKINVKHGCSLWILATFSYHAPCLEWRVFCRNSPFPR